MERAHVQSHGQLRTHQLSHTLLHLLCSLVGKGQGKNVPRVQPHVGMLQEISYLVSKHARFT